MKIIGEEKVSIRDLIKNLNNQSKYFSDSFLIHIPIFLLLIKQILFYLMPLDVFLMNMCVVVLGLLVRREIKLRKARQIMKTQIFKEQYIPNVHAISLLLMLLVLNKIYIFPIKSHLIRIAIKMGKCSLNIYYNISMRCGVSAQN